MVHRALSAAESGQGMKLTTHLYLVLWLLIHEAQNSTQKYAFLTWCLLKQMNKFTVTFHIQPHEAALTLWFHIRFGSAWS
jgi:hypothetical protein